ncbi:heme oxygenase [Neolewinella xylanilytica]|uniref:Heme oxygenase n=1 Tax=Neolewinella xylanilytica TaxID=1514080 RepID=A0A2S6I934_9BACT|nr:biliverdin-producing heme oxygenase [Neolewinella xylanilytica]PPK88003.1 heme oxygenase [Neolewinella xylanilytica]
MSDGQQLLDRLRSATSADHRHLESMTMGAKMMDGSLTAAEYRRVIDWQRRVHLLLEPLVNGFARGDYAYRPRFLTPAPPSPDTSYDLPEVLGRLYVLEGASLGGSLIYRKLQDNERLRSEAPFTFYREQSEWGVKQWRAFTKMIATVPLGEDDLRRAEQSARDTFARFAAEWATPG